MRALTAFVLLLLFVPQSWTQIPHPSQVPDSPVLAQIRYVRGGAVAGIRQAMCMVIYRDGAFLVQQDFLPAKARLWSGTLYRRELQWLQRLIGSEELALVQSEQPDNSGLVRQEWESLALRARAPTQTVAFNWLNPDRTRPLPQVVKPLVNWLTTQNWEDRAQRQSGAPDVCKSLPRDFEVPLAPSPLAPK